MGLLEWVKDNMELVAASMVGAFGAGRMVVVQEDHTKKIDSLEVCHAEVKEDLTEIKGDIKTLLERTKHLAVVFMAVSFTISGYVPEKPKTQVVTICDKNNVCTEQVVSGSIK